MVLHISTSIFVRMSRSERDEIAAAIAEGHDIGLVAQTYAKFLSEFVPATGHFDDEIVLYSFHDMKKVGFWEKVSLEEFLDTYGQDLSVQAKECLRSCETFLSERHE